MSSFTTPLYLEYLDGRRWRLRDTFDYHVGDEESDWRVTVPAGFVTDFASIPRAFWWLVPPTGRHGKAALIHDYLYATTRYAREIADAIFLEAMGVLGVPWLIRNVMYLAVRIFGWRAYGKRRKPAGNHDPQTPDPRERLSPSAKSPLGAPEGEACGDCGDGG